MKTSLIKVKCIDTRGVQYLTNGKIYLATALSQAYSVYNDIQQIVTYDFYRFEPA